MSPPHRARRPYEGRAAGFRGLPIVGAIDGMTTSRSSSSSITIARGAATSDAGAGAGAARLAAGMPEKKLAGEVAGSGTEDALAGGGATAARGAAASAAVIDVAAALLGLSTDKPCQWHRPRLLLLKHGQVWGTRRASAARLRPDRGKGEAYLPRCARDVEAAAGSAGAAAETVFGSFRGEVRTGAGAGSPSLSESKMDLTRLRPPALTGAAPASSSAATAGMGTATGVAAGPGAGAVCRDAGAGTKSLVSTSSIGSSWSASEAAAGAPRFLVGDGAGFLAGDGGLVALVAGAGGLGPPPPEGFLKKLRMSYECVPASPPPVPHVLDPPGCVSAASSVMRLQRARALSQAPRCLLRIPRRAILSPFRFRHRLSCSVVHFLLASSVVSSLLSSARFLPSSSHRSLSSVSSPPSSPRLPTPPSSP